MKKIITRLVVVALVVTAGFRMNSNHEKINSSKNLNSGISSVVSVQTYEVKPIEIDQSLNLVGTFSANSEVNIVAESQGILTSVNVEQGQIKEVGSIIAVVDSKLKQLALRSAQIALEKQKRDLARCENLVKGGGANQQQLDDARTMYENALITLEQNKKQLTDATVKSPISGVITKKTMYKGSFVNIGATIATIVDISKLKLKLNVSESNVYKLKVGQRAQITTDIYPGVNFDGKVSFVSMSGDDSHTYDVEITVNNNSRTPLKAGTFANASINEFSPGKRLYIPREALLGSSRDAKVYLAENGKATLRDVIVNEANNKYLEVKSGLNEGDLVVTSGQINLENGKFIKTIK